MFKLVLIIVSIIFSKNISAQADIQSSPWYTNEIAGSILDECQQAREYMPSIYEYYQIDCNDLFHHYQSSSVEYSEEFAKKSPIKIGSFNIFKLGTGAARFKDLNIVAKIMNQWDLVAVNEISKIASEDLGTNNKLLTNYEREIFTLEQVRGAFRLPGYLLLLKELQQLEPEAGWSMLISPYFQSGAYELLAYYYKSSKVKPIRTSYCGRVNRYLRSFEGTKTVGNGREFACVAEMHLSENISKDQEAFFFRKPFIASFISGNFDFTLFNTHLRFNAPRDESQIEFIREHIIQVNIDPNLAPIARLNLAETARFAELKLILSLMDKIRQDRSGEKDVILLGDLNLEKKDFYFIVGHGPFDIWSALLDKVFPGGDIYIDEPTYIPRNENSQLSASNYDHFILDPSFSAECMKTKSSESSIAAEVFSFLKHHQNLELLSTPTTFDWNRDLKSKYLMPKKQIDQQKVTAALKEFDDQMENVFLVWNRQIIPTTESSNYQTLRSMFYERVFASQLDYFTSYQVYQEIISDHLPIVMECSTHHSDDD